MHPVTSPIYVYKPIKKNPLCPIPIKFYPRTSLTVIIAPSPEPSSSSPPHNTQLSPQPPDEKKNKDLKSALFRPRPSLNAALISLVRSLSNRDTCHTRARDGRVGGEGASPPLPLLLQPRLLIRAGPRGNAAEEERESVDMCVGACVCRCIYTCVLEERGWLEEEGRRGFRDRQGGRGGRERGRRGSGF